MGEIAVSCAPTEELVALGLGSCVGVAIVDRGAGVAGMAHVVLPRSDGRRDRPGKFADTAVPGLIARLHAAGAAARRLEAVIAGGAQMFDSSDGLDIGARNVEAVRAQLERSRIPLRAAQTGGSQGRTLRVAVGGCAVSVRVAGEAPVTLLDGVRSRGAERLAAPSSRHGHATGHGRAILPACGVGGVAR